MTTTGCTISQLMECPTCNAIVTANVTVTTDTPDATIIGGLIVGRMMCDGCGQQLSMLVRVRPVGDE